MLLNFAFGQDIAYMADPMQAKATVKAMKDFILTYKGLLEKVVKVTFYVIWQKRELL